MKINVCARIDGDIRDQIMQVSGAIFALTGAKTFPGSGRLLHNTVYLTDYPGEYQQAVCARVERQVRRLRDRPIMQSTGKLTIPTAGWLFYDLFPSPAQRRVQQDLVHALSDLRTLDQDPPSWLVNFPEKRETFLRCGSPNVGNFYNPHATLFANEGPETLRLITESPSIKELMANTVQTYLDEIIVGRADDDGQIVEIYETFTL